MPASSHRSARQGKRAAAREMAAEATAAEAAEGEFDSMALRAASNAWSTRCGRAEIPKRDTRTKGINKRIHRDENEKRVTKRNYSRQQVKRDENQVVFSACTGYNGFKFTWRSLNGFRFDRRASDGATHGARVCPKGSRTGNKRIRPGARDGPFRAGTHGRARHPGDLLPDSIGGTGDGLYFPWLSL